jgi:hypothetical protein
METGPASPETVGVSGIVKLGFTAALVLGGIAAGVILAATVLLG